ncbi:MAG: DUF2182 domain-containing protein [Actinobacteria bacterium]|nr:MAG: DUF2182 domain-containing protein [Actinomycetota bacterium]
MFLAVWTGSMAAMMLPGTVPLLRLDYAVTRSRARTALVVAGYLAVWAALGLAALPLDGVFMGRGRWLLVAALGAAAAYQLSPLKRRCLARCRAPLGRVLHGWRDGALGALRLGAANGVWCVGCCVGLTVALLALGMMSPHWMAAFTVVVTAEKTAPVLLSRPLATGLAIGAVAWAV